MSESVKNTRNEKGQFLKGTVPNPNGRPKKKPNYLEEQLEKKRERLAEMYIERASSNDDILIDLIRRLFNGK